MASRHAKKRRFFNFLPNRQLQRDQCGIKANNHGYELVYGKYLQDKDTGTPNAENIVRLAAHSGTVVGLVYPEHTNVRCRFFDWYQNRSSGKFLGFYSLANGGKRRCQQSKPLNTAVKSGDGSTRTI